MHLHYSVPRACKRSMIVCASLFLLHRHFRPRGSVLKKTSPYPPRKTFRPFSSTTIFNPTASATDTSGILYETIEDVERLEHYRPGGYHPVTIGDRFHDRYRVIHKLGHGTGSTIWLARDEKCNIYVALKVHTADLNPLEIDVLSKLSNSQQISDIGRNMIAPIWDRFDIQGPNGNHVCLVTSPPRMSISDTKNGSLISLFQLHVARALVAQLVMAVVYIHSEGYVQGNLHSGHILFQPSLEFDQLSTETLYELYGEPVLEPVNRLDGQKLPPGVPQHGVLPIWLGKASENVTLPEAKILLSDFGETFAPAQEQKFESHIPLSIRPPESRFESNKPLTFASDIWTLACTIWDILAQRSLFEGFLTNEEDMTCQQTSALGPLPAEWREKREERHVKFAEPCKPSDSQNPYPSWEDRFETSVQQPRIKEGMPPLEPSERDALFSMLRSMLSFRPEDRPSAQQVLESEWMVKWALPESEKIRNTQQ